MESQHESRGEGRAKGDHVPAAPSEGSDLDAPRPPREGLEWTLIEPIETPDDTGEPTLKPSQGPVSAAPRVPVQRPAAGKPSAAGPAEGAAAASAPPAPPAAPESPRAPESPAAPESPRSPKAAAARVDTAAASVAAVDPRTTPAPAAQAAATPEAGLEAAPQAPRADPSARRRPQERELRSVELARPGRAAEERAGQGSQASHSSWVPGAAAPIAVASTAVKERAPWVPWAVAFAAALIALMLGVLFNSAANELEALSAQRGSGEPGATASADFEALRGELERSRSRVSELENQALQAESLSRDLADAQRDLAALSAERADMQKAVNELERDARAKEAQRDELRQRVGVIERALAKAAAAGSPTPAGDELTPIDAAAVMQRLVTLETEANQANAELETLRPELAEARARLADAERGLADATRARGDLSGELVGTQSELSSAREKAESALARAAQLETELGRAREVAARTQEELLQAQKARDALAVDLESLRSVRTDLAQKVAEFTAAADAQGRDLERERAARAAAEAALSEKGSIPAALQQELEAARAQAREAIEALAAQRNEATAARTERESEAAAWRLSLEQEQRARTDAEAGLAGAAQERQALTEALNRAQDQAKTLREQLDRGDQERDALSQALSGLQAEFDQARAALQQETAARAEVEGALDGERAAKEAAARESRDLASDLSRARTELEVAARERDAARAELESDRAQSTDASTRLAADLANERAARQALAVQLEEERAAKAALETGARQAADVLARSQSDLQQVAGERDAASAAALANEQRAAGLQRTLEATQRERDEARTALESASVARAELEAQLATARRENEALSQDSSGSGGTLTALRSDLLAAVRDRDAAKNALELLRTQGSDAAARLTRELADERAALTQERTARAQTQAQLVQARQDQERGAVELDTRRAELEAAQRERDEARAELTRARAQGSAATGNLASELERARQERDAARAEVAREGAARADLERRLADQSASAAAAAGSDTARELAALRARNVELLGNLESLRRVTGGAGLRADGFDRVVARVEAGRGAEAASLFDALVRQGTFAPASGDGSDFLRALTASAAALESATAQRAQDGAPATQDLMEARARMDEAYQRLADLDSQGGEWLGAGESADAASQRLSSAERAAGRIKDRLDAAWGDMASLDASDWQWILGRGFDQAPDAVQKHELLFHCGHAREFVQRYAGELAATAEVDGELDLEGLRAAEQLGAWARRFELRPVLERDAAEQKLLWLWYAKRWYLGDSEAEAPFDFGGQPVPAPAAPLNDWRSELRLQVALAAPHSAWPPSPGQASVYRILGDSRSHWRVDALQSAVAQRWSLLRGHFGARGEPLGAPVRVEIQRSGRSFRYANADRPLIDLSATGDGVGIAPRPALDGDDPPAAIGVTSADLAAWRERLSNDTGPCLVVREGEWTRWFSPTLGLVKEERQAPDGVVRIELACITRTP